MCVRSDEEAPDAAGERLGTEDAGRVLLRSSVGFGKIYSEM